MKHNEEKTKHLTLIKEFYELVIDAIPVESCKAHEIVSKLLVSLDISLDKINDFSVLESSEVLGYIEELIIDLNNQNSFLPNPE